MEMESQRCPAAIQFQGPFRQGRPVELPGSLIIGSDPACQLVLPALATSRTLTWQILTGDQAVPFATGRTKGKLNGAPFGDAVLQPAIACNGENLP